MSNNYLLGFNTRNIGTSGRTSTSVNLGSPYGGKGSMSRIYNWCNRTCPDPINCVFQQGKENKSHSETNTYWTNINVSQLNLGSIVGNIGLNGEIILGGANGGQLQYSTNLGNSWSAVTGTPNLPGGVRAGWSSVVMSDDTKFVVATPYVSYTQQNPNDFTEYNAIWFKSDSSPWQKLQSCPLEGGGTLYFNDIGGDGTGNGKKLLFISSGISQDGKYMAAITTPRFEDGELVYLIFSNNYGTTGSWNAITLDPYTQNNVTTFVSSISICSNVNNYALITSKLYLNNIQSPPGYENGTCCVSNSIDGGFTVPTGVTGNDFIYSSMSNNGQYQVVVTATNPQSGNISIPSRLYLSSNSGNTFNQIIELPYIDDDNYLKFGGVSMSYDGKYITASVLDKYGVFQYIYVSSNIGVTWTKIYNDINGSQINVTGQYAGFLNLNYSGKYQMLTGTDGLYINNNFGK